VTRQFLPKVLGVRIVQDEAVDPDLDQGERPLADRDPARRAILVAPDLTPAVALEVVVA
jgi:hypothetical protein